MASSAAHVALEAHRLERVFEGRGGLGSLGAERRQQGRHDAQHRGGRGTQQRQRATQQRDHGQALVMLERRGISRAVGAQPEQQRVDRGARLEGDLGLDLGAQRDEREALFLEAGEDALGQRLGVFVVRERAHAMSLSARVGHVRFLPKLWRGSGGGRTPMT